MIKITPLKAFTLVDLVLSILLLGMILIISKQTHGFLSQNTHMNELKYLALNKIDSEMSRLVYAYENKPPASFTSVTSSTTNTTSSNFDNFKIPFFIYSDKIALYNKKIFNKPYGLLISNNLNVVELKDKSHNPNIVDIGDIVGIIGWKVSLDSIEKEANLSLSITYPYKVDKISSNGMVILVHLNGDSINIPKPDYSSEETINLKTSTKIK